MAAKISVIIPVLKEESGINVLLEDIERKFFNPAAQVVVVDCDPRSSTLNAITRTHPDLQKIRTHKGRAVQMNAGAAAADGDVLLFLHADTRLPESAPDDISEAFEDPCVVAGAFRLKLDSDNPFLKFVSYTASLRSEITKIPLGDQALFIRRKYFNSIGGFREMPLMEDTEIMERIKKNNGKIKIVGSSVVSSARRWREGGIFVNTFKNHLVRFLYSLGVSPVRLHRMYYGS